MAGASLVVLLRLNPMLHGRPKSSPLEDPKAWWRYAILCVQHRPNSRPWGDVQQIVQCREKYIDLVVKNLESETEQTGFHGGLSSSESQALLEMENMLPIETLLAFHLLALRRVFDHRCSHKKATASTEINGRRKKKKSNSFRRLWKSIGTFLLLFIVLLLLLLAAVTHYLFPFTAGYRIIVRERGGIS